MTIVSLALIAALVCLVVALMLFHHASQAHPDILDELSLHSDALWGFTIIREVFRGWEYSPLGRWLGLVALLCLIGAGVGYLFA